MSIIKIGSIIMIILGVYGILNLFIGKKKPLHLYLKKNVKINYKCYKYYKYYYLINYIIFIIWGFFYWRYIPTQDLILNTIYLYLVVTCSIMQIIGLFIDSKYISK